MFEGFVQDGEIGCGLLEMPQGQRCYPKAERVMVMLRIREGKGFVTMARGQRCCVHAPMEKVPSTLQSRYKSE